MKLRIILLSFSLMLLSYGSPQAQTKVGYTNAELILSYMPELKTMNQTLAAYQKNLATTLKTKEDYAKQKLQEFYEQKQANSLTEEQSSAKEQELMKLDKELQQLAAESDNKLAQKRQELLQPILDKLQLAIDDIAAEDGYKLILNQTTSSGVSTILYGPEEDNITEKVMAKLGIKIERNE